MRLRRVAAGLCFAVAALSYGSAARAQTDAGEIEFWRTVRDTASPAELEAYLAAYPEGRFVALARIRLRALAEAARKEDDSSTEARQGSSEGAAAPPVHECDRLASHPFDPDRVADGIEFQVLNAERAMRACQEAVALYPATARFQFQLGRAFHKKRTYDEALAWYRKAAKSGFAPAMTNIGFLYEPIATPGGAKHEQWPGGATDYTRAVRWYRKAARRGDARAMIRLGAIYTRGNKEYLGP